MSSEEERADESALKVVDRRRFNEEGELKDGAANQRNSPADGIVDGSTKATPRSSVEKPVLNSKPETELTNSREESNSKGKEMKESVKPKPEETSGTEQEQYSASTLNFSTFVMGLAHQAFILLGKVEDPYTGKMNVNIEGARQTIDTIAILEEKTKGNLTSDEERLVKEALAGLRMEFVKSSKENT